jgi:hypothetical protein
MELNGNGKRKEARNGKEITETQVWRLSGNITKPGMCAE